jgi:hypothetical protein
MLQAGGRTRTEGLFSGRRFVGGAVLGVKQQDRTRVRVEHDFGRIAGYAVLLPFARFEFAFDVQLRAFLHVLFDDADKPLAAHNDVMLLGLGLLFAAGLILPALAGREGKIRDLVAAREGPTLFLL